MTRARSSYLGSADVAPILGIPAYGRTALTVWDDKAGFGVEREPTSLMRWGLILEPVILREYAKQTGRKLTRTHRQRFLDGYPHLGCTIDADAGDRVVEAKFSPFERDYGEPADGAEGLPLNIRAQVQWQLLITGYERADVPVLVRGYDLRIFEVEADRDFQIELRDELDDFWNEHVVPRIPPTLDDPEQLAEYLAGKVDDGSTIEAPASLGPVFRRLAQARHDQHDAEYRRKALEAILKATMGEATTLIGKDVTVTWTRKPRKVVAWELVAIAFRKRIESIEAAFGPGGAAALTEQLDAIVSLYTTHPPYPRFSPKFEGPLADLEAISPQVEGVPDALSN